MNAARLIENFERISEVPDAVPRLRRFVLDLAVRGKLVEQDRGDEPASELLKRIQAEKAQLVKEGKLKKTAIESERGSFDAPFSLPPSWTWGCLGDVAQYGLSEKVDSNKDIAVDAWVLDLEDVEKDTSRLIERMPSSARPFRSTKTIFKCGDVLFGKLRPYLNKVLVADQDGVCTTEIIPIRGYCGLVPEYVKLVLKSPLTMTRVDRLMYGMKMPRLGTGDAVALSFPLPPLAEQHRIVAKMDELMALCDQLAATQAERESRRDRVVAASLNRLNNGANAEAFREHARFHLHHLPRLTTRPEHIQELRETILNLAVRGRLVCQDPNDESAYELLKRIQSEKARRLISGELRKQQFLPDIGVSEAPFDIPDSWRWVRVDDCFNVGGGIQKTPARTPQDNAYPYIGVGNVYRGRLDLSEVKQFELLEGDLERFRLVKGDILVVEGNGSANEIGRCAMWAGEIDECVHQNHIIRCRPFILELAPYVLKYLNSPNGIQVMKALAITSSGLYSLSVGKIRTIMFPLPPFAEQHRIVAKVNELMALCDRLEAQLTTTALTRHQLLEATIHQAPFQGRLNFSKVRADESYGQRNPRDVSIGIGR